MAITSKSTKEELYNAIRRERKHQLEKYPSDSEYPRTLLGYMAVAEEEVNEAILAYCKNTGDEEARRELLQVVATGVAWLETRQGQSWDTVGLELVYEDEYPTIRWLQLIKAQFEIARRHLLEEPGETFALGVAFNKAISMGMRCLILHGVAERTMLQREFEAVLPYMPITDEQTEEDQKPKTIQVERNQRGFCGGEFTDLYGEPCIIRESSLATDDAIWLGIHDSRPYTPGDDRVSTLMHLNRAHVTALLPLLQYFADNGELPRPDQEGANDA